MITSKTVALLLSAHNGSVYIYVSY